MFLAELVPFSESYLLIHASECLLLFCTKIVERIFKTLSNLKILTLHAIACIFICFSLALCLFLVGGFCASSLFVFIYKVGPFYISLSI